MRGSKHSTRGGSGFVVVIRHDKLAPIVLDHVTSEVEIVLVLGQITRKLGVGRRFGSSEQLGDVFSFSRVFALSNEGVRCGLDGQKEGESNSGEVHVET